MTSWLNRATVTGSTTPRAETTRFLTCLAQLLNAVSGGNLALQFPATQGHVHVKLLDPSRGSRVLAQVLRSDGKQLLAQNFWLSKSRNSDLSSGVITSTFLTATRRDSTPWFSDSSTAC